MKSSFNQITLRIHQLMPSSKGPGTESKHISPNQDIILPTIVRTIVDTIVSRVTGGDGRFVDLMIILY